MSQHVAYRRESLLANCVAISESNNSRFDRRSTYNEAFTAMSHANQSFPSTRNNQRRTTSETIKKEVEQ
ncbi:hypothetical protein CIP100161_01678 [Corynebacterium diphtheriae]|nr:hypothetical protein CIP100161_01678 [Corynebacterium diphtheriae]